MDYANKHKHLDYIQAVINRLAGNSFAVKGWAVTILTALFALASAASVQNEVVWLGLLPIFAFWLLDGYFLWQERLFVAKFNEVAEKRETEIDFSMNPRVHIGGNRKWLSSVFSKTLLVFYLSLIGLCVAITFFVLPLMEEG